MGIGSGTGGKGSGTGKRHRVTARSRANLLSPWQPGQSGNPKGGPRKPQSLTTALREAVDPALIAAKLVELAEAGDIAALRYVYDRLEGTPVQRREDITPEVIRERVEKLAAELQLDAPTLMAEYLRLREAS